MTMKRCLGTGVMLLAGLWAALPARAAGGEDAVLRSRGTSLTDLF